MGEQTIHTVSTATGGFSVGHFAEFDYAGKAIVGVVESIEPDGSLTLGCGPEGRWVMPVAECRPWGPPLGALPGDIPTDSAGPALSAASPSGTGGLAQVDELLARLEAATLTLTAHTRTLREELEGQRRAVWDSLIDSARRQEQVPSDTQAGYTMAWRAAHDLLTGRHLEDHEYEALLAAELDSRYRKDRAKGGGPS